MAHEPVGAKVLRGVDLPKRSNIRHPLKA